MLPERNHSAAQGEAAVGRLASLEPPTHLGPRVGMNPVRGALGVELQPKGAEGLGLRRRTAGKVLVGRTARVQGACRRCRTCSECILGASGRAGSSRMPPPPGAEPTRMYCLRSGGRSGDLRPLSLACRRLSSPCPHASRPLCTSVS